jgi:hypothetical protein
MLYKLNGNHSSSSWKDSKYVILPTALPKITKCVYFYINFVNANRKTRYICNKHFFIPQTLQKHAVTHPEVSANVLN